jgi:uncharacterized membrane protein
VDALLFPVTLAAALGCGLVSGVFFAFSSFVMKSLLRLRPESGIAAMQTINVVVLGVFVGTAAACLFLAVFSLLRWSSPGAVSLLAASGLYLLGTFGVTMAFNVPLNDSLARVDPARAEAAETWRSYGVAWTRWNHVRTVAALAAAALFILAL